VGERSEPAGGDRGGDRSHPWRALRQGLADLGARQPPTPGSGRLGAALALFREVQGDLELLLTRRRDDLTHHPGQISFPGGRVEPGESVAEAALREAHEECDLDPGTVEVLGTLPAFYIPPSRFWLQVVVGRWSAPHPLRPAEAEVAEILPVRVGTLRDPGRWRVVRRLSTRSESWAWDLDGGHLLWGATGMVTAVLLELLDPEWHSGTELAELPADREVVPWATDAALIPRPGPARLHGTPEVAVGALHAAAGGGIDDAARVTAQAVAQLAGPTARVVVLAGPGRTGEVGIGAAAALVAAGRDVRIVLTAARALPEALADRVHLFDGALPSADVVVDALTGRGLRGAAEGAVRDVILALRGIGAPVVAIDLPSGMHPDVGLVGDAVSADVTLSLGAPADGLFRPGMGPFVGDLYLVGHGGRAGAADPIVRVVADG
jgi:NAD(P)H-hydrate repair Nnr-like enzyme with NAD(P)H-hydrate epimerase domain/8-oxo-dGTP pyrophosphatase MutT (NUDIX family)